MLTDLLAVVLGFITVMLLLSLVVTGLVQAISSMAALRLRNLRHGLTALISQSTQLSESESGTVAQKILEVQNLKLGPNLSPSAETVANRVGESGLIRTSKAFLQPELTWIDIESFKSSLGLVNQEVLKNLPADFDQCFALAEAYMQKRFALIARYLAIVVSIAVAVSFQVSAPKLLRDLSEDSAMRDRYAAVGTRIAQEDPEALRTSPAMDFEKAGLEAISQLQLRHEDLAAAFEQIVATGKSAAELRQEMERVLASDPQRAKIVAEYEALIDDQLEEQVRSGEALATSATSELEGLDLTIWESGSSFYLDDHCIQWRNVFGVLITAMLLTFGAPFWFERLKEVARLRDTIGSKGPKTS